MSNFVRAIVIKDDQLLVMKRNKYGHEYYTLIGGSVEPGETNEQALRRELDEETGLVIQNPRSMFEETSDGSYGNQYIYLCEYQSGEPKLSNDAIETSLNKQGQNLYQPMWLPIDQLASSELLSQTLKQALLDGIKNGWPKRPIKLHS